VKAKVRLKGEEGGGQRRISKHGRQKEKLIYEQTAEAGRKAASTHGLG